MRTSIRKMALYRDKDYCRVTLKHSHKTPALYLPLLVRYSDHAQYNLTQKQQRPDPLNENRITLIRF
ncbi:MAG: hypothetical protein ACI9XU_000694 [Arenicella sp.]|jgi:hypothetical protein